MDAAYRRWHSGASSVDPEWTVGVPLFPDESVSSWLVRAALAHGCGPRALTGWVWPGWHAWAVDLDKGLNDDRLAQLVRVSGVSATAFRRADLTCIAERVEGRQVDPNRAWRWIIPRGLQRDDRQGAPQFCPLCLAHDHRPYHRLSWRLAWHTACPIHNVALADRCHHCGAKVFPHRLRATAGHAGVCAECGSDLSDAKLMESQPDALEFQMAGDRAFHTGEAPCLSANLRTAQWFEVADFFVAFLRRILARPNSSSADLLERLGTEPPTHIPARPGARVERMENPHRQALLGRVWRIMAKDAKSFRDAISLSGISRQALTEKDRRIPAPIRDILPELPDNGREHYSSRSVRSRRPRGRNEVQRMMNRLIRTLETES